jgi:hypothetical protein
MVILMYGSANNYLKEAQPAATIEPPSKAIGGASASSSYF